MNQVVHVEEKIAAAPALVWSLLSDAVTWPEWSVMTEASLEQGADDGRAEGVGAIRRFRSGKVTSREVIVAFEPERRLAYELLSGLPLRGYHAEVTLEPDGPGTRLVWHSTFGAKAPVTGWIYRRALQKFIATLAADLGRAAEQLPVVDPAPAAADPRS